MVNFGDRHGSALEILPATNIWRPGEREVGLVTADQLPAYLALMEPDHLWGLAAPGAERRQPHACPLLNQSPTTSTPGPAALPGGRSPALPSDA